MQPRSSTSKTALYCTLVGIKNLRDCNVHWLVHCRTSKSALYIGRNDWMDSLYWELNIRYPNNIMNTFISKFYTFLPFLAHSISTLSTYFMCELWSRVFVTQTEVYCGIWSFLLLAGTTCWHPAQILSWQWLHILPTQWTYITCEPTLSTNLLYQHLAINNQKKNHKLKISAQILFTVYQITLTM